MKWMTEKLSNKFGKNLVIFIIWLILFRIDAKYWRMLRSIDEPQEYFSAGVFMSTFEPFMRLQCHLGNRVVLMNCNRIRDDHDHELLKKDTFRLLRDECSDLSSSSFHAVSDWICLKYFIDKYARLPRLLRS